MYYRDANGRLLIINICYTIGALLVYDITDKDSFDKVRSWVNELFKCAG